MSFYRNTVFLFKGLSEFTKGGYEKAERSFNQNALNVDLKEKVALVTGANSGLGKEVAIALAERGATVYMVCRNKERGEEARNEIIDRTKNEKIILKIADLSDLGQISSLVEEFKKESQKLDILVNNGGAMVQTRTVTKDGVEVNFATNTLGTFFLTNSLLDILAKSAPSRVVTVSSAGMYTMKLDVDDLEFQKGTFDGTFAYAQNKRQQVILTEMWSAKYAHHGISFYSCHPGWADTPGVQTSMPGFYEKTKDMMRTAKQGADTIVWLSVANEVPHKIKSGDFVQDRVSVSKHLTWAWTQQKPEEEERLWKKLEEYVKKITGQDCPSL